MKCKECKYYKGSELHGECRAFPPQIIHHMIVDGSDEAELINASLMPRVLSDDPGCGLFNGGAHA